MIVVCDLSFREAIHIHMMLRIIQFYFRMILVDVATKVCFDDFQDIVVPLYKNTNHVYDMVL